MFQFTSNVHVYKVRATNICTMFMYRGVSARSQINEQATELSPDCWITSLTAAAVASWVLVKDTLTKINALATVGTDTVISKCVQRSLCPPE